MTKEVRLTVRGVQVQEDKTEENMEVVSVGQMYEKNGFVCLNFEEVVDESESGVVQVVKNLMKIRNDQVELIKRGPTESHMVFVPDRATYTYYSTPLGELEVSIFTKQIQRQQKPNGFRLVLEYDLEMNQTFITQCCVDIEVEQ